MGDPFDEEMEVPAAVECILEAPLPASVEGMLSQICREKNQEAPDVWIRRRMGSIGEQGSLAILKIIASRPIKKTLSAFLLHMIDRYPACLSSSPFTTPQKRTSPSLLPTPGSEGKRVKGASSSEQFLARPQSASPKKVYRQLNLSFGNEPLSICKRKTSDTISQQLMVLSELEFRKLFLVLSYIGSNNLEDVIPLKLLMIL